jgi:hypothetical protein
MMGSQAKAFYHNRRVLSTIRGWCLHLAGLAGYNGTGCCPDEYQLHRLVPVARSLWQRLWALNETAMQAYTKVRPRLHCSACCLATWLKMTNKDKSCTD